jgi:hypothetical protein
MRRLRPRREVKHNCPSKAGRDRAELILDLRAEVRPTRDALDGLADDGDEPDGGVPTPAVCQRGRSSQAMRSRSGSSPTVGSLCG